MMVKSYGGMTETLNFLSEIEQLQLQALSKWWYKTGVGRVQTVICLDKVFFFVD